MAALSVLVISACMARVSPAEVKFADASESPTSQPPKPLGGALIDDGRVLILPVQVKRLDADVLSVLDDMIVASVSDIGKLQPIAYSDIEAFLTQEKLADILSSSGVASAEHAGELISADYLLSTTANRLGRYLLLSMTLIENKSNSPVRRAQVQVINNEEYFAAACQRVVQQLFVPQDKSMANKPATQSIVAQDENEQTRATAIQQNTLYVRFNNLDIVLNPPVATMTFAEAREYCDHLEVGGITDWRLPTIDELLVLLDTCKTCSESDAEMSCREVTDFSGACGVYWSSKLHKGSQNTVEYVDFVHGYAHTDASWNGNLVRCVH